MKDGMARGGASAPGADDSDPRFYVHDSISPGGVNSPEGWLRDGSLVGVVDEKVGGIVAYCHHATADQLVRALELLAEVDRKSA